MCEAHVYIRKGGKDELLLESVDKVVPVDGELHLENIFGQRQDRINLLNIVLCFPLLSNWQGGYLTVLPAGVFFYLVYQTYQFSSSKDECSPVFMLGYFVVLH
ncbi:MAG: hypothetical protein CVV03_00540 [Firmicutes bacterium HGW-Firmicutes-8]|nr:MAG: hypothetical protein CVV03_00540 [Firmicutes bacterium HGW-Firmicutes-8]